MPTDLLNIMSEIKKHIFNKYPRYFNNFDDAEIVYLDKKMVNNTLSQLDITLPDLLDFEHKELFVMPPSGKKSTNNSLCKTWKKSLGILQKILTLLKKSGLILETTLSKQ